MAEKNLIPFLNLEKNMKLFERSYHGFHYWQYLRFAVCESLYGSRLKVEKRVQEETSSRYRKQLLVVVRRLFSDLVHDLILLHFGKRYDLMVFRQTPEKDQFFDSWNIPESIRTITFRTGAFSEDEKYHYVGIPRIKAKIKYLFRRKLNTLPEDAAEHKFLVSMRNELMSIFGQCLSVDEMEHSIKYYYYIHYYYTKFFRKVFNRTKCKAILCIVYYNCTLYPVFEVAKKMGIPIFELQHGVINNHESYWFEDRRGINNYTPDYLLTFGDIHCEWIKLVNGSKAVSIGFPYQEQMIRKLDHLVPRKDTVIFYPETEEIFEELIDEFINNNWKDYNILIKLHPLQFGHVKEIFPRLYHNEHAQFIESQEKGIYYWLKYAVHHVIAGSTVGMEALAFDHCNVYIIETIEHDHTQCLLEWGVAQGFKTADELLSEIISNDTNSIKDGFQISENNQCIYKARNGLWKRNAKENMEMFFSEVSKKDWKI